MLYFLFSVSGPLVVEALGPGVVGDMSSFSVAPPPNLLMGKLDISLVKLFPPGEPIDASDIVALSGSMKEPAPNGFLVFSFLNWASASLQAKSELSKVGCL